MDKSVKIKKINVTRLGPVDEFIMEPAELNLIYGRNETGKTYLVEFIIRFLLGAPGSWNLRDVNLSGKIKVGGLAKKDKEFSPGRKKKLRKYMEKAGAGLPPGLERLLVVKGADISISSSHGGIDAFVVKKLLSGREILDSIEKRIPSTFREAELSGESIEVSCSTNDAKDMYAARDEVEKIERLLNDINQNYTLGPIVLLDDEIKTLEENIKEQNRGRRHRGYLLSQKIEKLKRRRDQLNPDETETLSNKIVEYRTAEENINREEDRLKEVRKLSENYIWLREAADIYKELLQQQRRIPFSWCIFIIAALLLTAVVPLVSGSKIWPLLVAGVFVILFTVFKKQGLFNNEAAGEEVNAIRDKFQELFGRRLTGYSELKEKLKEEEKYRQRTGGIKENLKEPRRKLERLKNKINGIFLRTASNTQAPEEWKDAAERIKNKIRENDQKITEIEKELASLNIEPEEYIPDYSGREYSREELAGFKAKKKEIEDKKEEYTDSLKEIKNRLVQETGADISENFNELIDRLRNKRKNTLNRLKKLRSKIIGLKSVYKVIERLKSKEDEKIKESLSSDIVQSPVKELTRRYERVKINGDKVAVSDQYRDYDIEDISTGTLEQILIALRMGITRKIMRGRKMFFIFDDAFQHTDWERRDYMVEGLVGAASAGRQIFYFIMDDHIRDLFKKKGAKLKSKIKYRQI